MPITLTETAKELAQAAVEIDTYLNEAYRARVLSHFTKAADGSNEPIMVPLMLGGRETMVPRMSMNDHKQLEADEIEIALDSDVDLEGRVFRNPMRQVLECIKGHNNQGRVGVRVYDGLGAFVVDDADAPSGGPPGGPPFLVLPTFGEFTIQDTLFRIETLMVKNNGDVWLRLMGDNIDFSLLDRVRLDWGLPGQDVAERYQVLGSTQFGSAQLDTMGRVYMTSNIDSLDWLRLLDDGEHFEVAFYDAALEREIEEIIGRELEGPETHYDIMVTLKSGLDPTSSHLNLRCKFTRQPGAEGVERINDWLNQTLGNTLIA